MMLAQPGRPVPSGEGQKERRKKEKRPLSATGGALRAGV